MKHLVADNGSLRRSLVQTVLSYDLNANTYVANSIAFANIEFTLLTRDRAAYLVDRYSERKERVEELSRRVNQRSI